MCQLLSETTNRDKESDWSIQPDVSTYYAYLYQRNIMNPIWNIITPEVSKEELKHRRMMDIKNRTPLHLQRGKLRLQSFVSNGKSLTPATPEEIAELNDYLDYLAVKQITGSIS